MENSIDQEILVFKMLCVMRHVTLVTFHLSPNHHSCLLNGQDIFLMEFSHMDYNADFKIYLFVLELYGRGELLGIFCCKTFHELIYILWILVLSYSLT